jgi:kynureninase
MKNEFEAITGAFAFRLSNPAVLPMVSLLATLQIMDRVGTKAMIAKQRLLTGYMEALLRSELGDSLVSIITPSDPTQRGCQLSLDFHKNAREFEHQLFHHGIVTDARDTIIRAAPTPLYNSYSDVQRFVHVLKSLLVAK